MNNAIVIKAPVRWLHTGQPVIFLAGSIEMGKAEDWQSQVAAALSDLDVLILNPRRDDWDDTWRQSIYDPRFREQVRWELDALEHASHILMYFAPDTFAPITLLEFGLYAQSGKLTVCCPDRFYRKGNVEVVCDRYHVPLVTTLDALIDIARCVVAPESVPYREDED